MDATKSHPCQDKRQLRMVLNGRHSGITGELFVHAAHEAALMQENHDSTVQTADKGAVSERKQPLKA